MTIEKKKKVLLGFALLILGATLLLPRIAQDPMYHLFADKRDWHGVPNFGDVMSNVTFLIAATLGYKWRPPVEGIARQAHLVLVVGLGLTAFGSAYYHLDPTTPRLIWDRLAMSIMFTGFLTYLVAVRVSEDWARKMLWPALVLGVLSVVYWSYTESYGVGDLRPYILVQYGSMLLAIVIVSWFDGPPGKGAIAALFAGYALAKIFEHFDREVFVLTSQNISGHTIRHLLAGLGAVEYVRRV